MRCTFCATGKGGFARNLMPHEIIDQVLTVQEQFGLRVSNVGESQTPSQALRDLQGQPQDPKTPGVVTNLLCLLRPFQI